MTSHVYVKITEGSNDVRISKEDAIKLRDFLLREFPKPQPSNTK